MDLAISRLVCWVGGMSVGDEAFQVLVHLTAAGCVARKYPVHFKVCVDKQLVEARHHSTYSTYRRSYYVPNHVSCRCDLLTRESWCLRTAAHASDPRTVPVCCWDVFVRRLSTCLTDSNSRHI